MEQEEEEENEEENDNIESDKMIKVNKLKMIFACHFIAIHFIKEKAEKNMTLCNTKIYFRQRNLLLLVLAKLPHQQKEMVNQVRNVEEDAAK